MILINLKILWWIILIGHQKIFFNSGLNTKILGNLRNINYEVKNVNEYKEDTTSELFEL